ncbi:MAG: hypothetical protein HYX62_04300 [Gammaproteobacteria bacterium]|nr:hypothetical protein [Gammaproteobacteria bacterium]
MRSSCKKYLAVAISGIGLAAGVQSALAVEINDKLSIYGYGYQAYMRASDNAYLGADKEGDWSYSALAIVLAAKLDGKTRVWANLHNTVERTRIDWAFLDYQASANLTLRVGQVKMPVGLYNEIRDIKFLQMSTLLPALYQEAAGITEEAYRGVGLTYNHDVGAGRLSWDGYAGQVVPIESLANQKMRRMVGGRVTYNAPVDGLRFMATAYDSQVENTGINEKSSKKAWVLSADYKANNLDLKAEYAPMKFFGVKGKTYYAQAGYTLAEKWTPFIRYDYVTTDSAESGDPSHYQKVASLGVGYKFSDSVGFRLENHWNRGYALPVASGETVAGAGKNNWNMFAASINFIF